jgi:hypothetical protein
MTTSQPPADELKPCRHQGGFRKMGVAGSSGFETTHKECKQCGMWFDVERLEGERDVVVQQTAAEITERQKAEADVTRLLIIEGELRRENARLAAELAALKGGAVTVSDEMVGAAVAAYSSKMDELLGMNAPQVAMRAALEAVAGMRGGG